MLSLLQEDKTAFYSLIHQIFTQCLAGDRLYSILSQNKKDKYLLWRTYMVGKGVTETVDISYYVRKSVRWGKIELWEYRGGGKLGGDI